MGRKNGDFFICRGNWRLKCGDIFFEGVEMIVFC